MMEDKLNFKIEDFRPIHINTLENKIKGSPHTAKIILFLYNKVVNEKAHTITVKDISEFLQSDYSTVYKDMEILKLLGILKRQNTSRRRMRYIIVEAEIKQCAKLALDILRQGQK